MTDSVSKGAVGEPISSILFRPANAAWLGFPDAAAAFVQNAGWFASRQVGSPLRVLSLMAISAALRSRGITMDADRKRAVIETMELGAHLNDRFDGDPHRAEDLRKHLASFSRTFQRDCICAYIKRLRFFERTRPQSAASLNSVRTYREHVNRLSLATLWAMASQCPIDTAERDIRMEKDLSILFRVVMLTQLIDDLLDIKKDRNRQLPSFATAIDSTPDALLPILHAYRHPAPMTWDSCFCLGGLLRLAAGAASAMIAYRRASGCFR